jgi:hypothetical protein
MKTNFAAKSLVAFQIVGVLVLAGTAAAAVSLTYATTSSQALGVKTVPVQYAAGPDAALGDYVTAFSISTNKTYYTATLKGVPESIVTLGDVVDVTNVDARAHNVTLTAPQNANANVLVYKVDWYDGATLVGTLDFKAASPSATFSGMAAAKTYAGKVTVHLAGGAGSNNVNDPAMSITMTVSS